MNIENIKKKEEENRQEIKDMYEKLGEPYIGKFFKKYHERGKYHGDRTYFYYLYIHGVNDQSLSGIEFRKSEFQRVGIWIEYDEGGIGSWTEIGKEEFQEGVQGLLNSFHLNNLLEFKK